MSEERKTASVIAPPPIIVLLLLLAGLELDRIWPAPFLDDTVQYVLGAVFIVPAIGLALWAVRCFGHKKTAVEPWHPSTALVTEGPYKHTRNPMYLAMVTLFLGLGFALDTLWLLAVWQVLVATLHWGVIRREERYLEGLFGEDYRAFCRQVRRWL
ncbi:MAG: isoprenylcysteine carboxylmethyltransferase family protein [Rhodospirillales bacterium]|nr:isoprenylcysteine carboxylmethyltransferase family protein [Rhodospirillales bacterium]